MKVRVRLSVSRKCSTLGRWVRVEQGQRCNSEEGPEKSHEPGKGEKEVEEENDRMSISTKIQTQL